MPLLGERETAALRSPAGNISTIDGRKTMANPGSHVQRTPVRAELRSTAFSDHTTIPERYSYDGGNVSPPLEWHGIPDDAVELVLLCEDQDAPGGPFTHWVLTGIAPTTIGVRAEASPLPAVAGRNDFG